MKLLAFGEILWDVYPDKKCIGGAPFNFAAHFAKHENAAYPVTCVGNDELGRETLDFLEKSGVGREYVGYSDKPTGRCVVTLDENKVPTYDLKTDVAWDDIKCPDICKKQFDALYFGTLSLRSKNNMQSLELLLSIGNFREVFVDVNLRAPFYSENSVGFALSRATILKISDEELETTLRLAGLPQENDPQSAAKLICEKYKNAGLVIITLGKNGSFAYDAECEKGYFCESVKTAVASTVGAGDSFSAAFLDGYLRGKSIPDCLSHASKVASFVVSKYDAVPDYSPKDFD